MKKRYLWLISAHEAVELNLISIEFKNDYSVYEWDIYDEYPKDKKEEYMYVADDKVWSRLNNIMGVPECHSYNKRKILKMIGLEEYLI